MITTLMLILACSGDSDTPDAAPPATTPAPAAAPAAAAPAKAPPAAASSNPHELPGYDGTFAGDPLLTKQQVAMSTAKDARTLRNEIYARYGRAFKSEDLQAHFGKASWYKVKEDFSDSWLTKHDQANVALIQRFEQDTAKTALQRAEYSNGSAAITFVDAKTAEISDGSEDVYNWERKTRHWVAMGDFVVTWEGGSGTWNPQASGMTSIQLWELDHQNNDVTSVSELKPLRG